MGKGMGMENCSIPMEHITRGSSGKGYCGERGHYFMEQISQHMREIGFRTILRVMVSFTTTM